MWPWLRSSMLGRTSLERNHRTRQVEVEDAHDVLFRKVMKLALGSPPALLTSTLTGPNSRVKRCQ